MPLHLVTGPANSGKTGRMYAALRGAVRAGRRALLLMPSEPEAARARAELAHEFPFGVQVMQADRCLERQWELRGDGRQIAKTATRDTLLARALRARERPAGHGAVVVLGAIAAEIASRGVLRDARLSRRGPGLLPALAEYRSCLDAAGLIEPGEAAALLASVPPPADLILAHRFVDLSSAQEAVLTSWGSGAADVWISLPWDFDVPATDAVSPLVGRLMECGAVRELVEADRSEGADDPPELARIARELFAHPHPRAGDGHVRLGVAAGDDAEAEMVATYVARWVAAGYAPDRIAVAFPDPARRLGCLTRALARRGLEADLDFGIPVTGTPLGRAMRHLWLFAAAGMERERLSAFLRTPFSGVPPALSDELDATWRSRRLESGEGLIRGADRWQALVRDVRALSRRRLDRQAARNWQTVVDSLLSNGQASASVDPRDTELDAAVHGYFLRLLDEALLLESQPMSADELWAAFMTGRVAPSAAERPGHIQVMSIGRLRSRRFDGVVLAGLTASEIPGRGAGEPLEGDVARETLEGVGVQLEVTERAGEERLAFYLAATRARKSLAIVRRECDDEGRSLHESVFWDEFLDLYRDPSPSGDEAVGPRADTLDVTPGPDAATAARVARGRLECSRVLEELAERACFSAGELETYTACPYKWFVCNALRPRPLAPAIDAAASGTLAHEALAAFYRRWLEETGERRVRPETVPEALALAERETDRVLAGAPRAETLAEDDLLSSVRRQVQTLVERDATFLPAHEPRFFEWTFGRDDDPIDLGGVRVRGRIDRIDVGETGLVVVDYKRSTASSLSQIRAKGLLQLQLYAAAASRRLGLPVAGGLYRALASTDGDRGFVLGDVEGAFKPRDVIERAELADLLDVAVAAARSAAEGIRAGRIAPAPEAERCRTCPAATFCAASA